MTAAELVNQMDELRKNKPRPIEKLYGRMGPTEAQAQAWHEAMRKWNREYRKLSKQHKIQLELDNAAFYARR